MAAASHASSKRLLHILRERQIPLTGDDIEWAFQSQTTKDEVVRWVDEELQHATLLTFEELDL
jgi:hypothetical protein